MKAIRTRGLSRARLALSSIGALAACTSTVTVIESSGGGDAGATSTVGNGGSTNTVGSGGDGSTGGTGGTGGSACVSEKDEDLCAAQGYACGTFDTVDQCGVDRTVVCASCTAPATCGGAGVPFQCGPHPPLTGIDGYILEHTGSGPYAYKIAFAQNGVPNGGGFCCGSTIEEAAAYYYKSNLLFLPPPVTVKGGVIPLLNGVDGYIVPSANDPMMLEVLFAKDGALSGSSFCCAKTVAEARAAYPMLNLGSLPYYPK